MTQMVYDAFRKQRELNLMLGLQSNVENEMSKMNLPETVPAVV